LPIETEDIRQTSDQFEGRLSAAGFDEGNVAGLNPELLGQ
jgi:hypothetical protein